MKNILKTILILFISLFVFSGCKKETTGGYTHVTTFPLLSIKGGSKVVLPLGGTYQEPGFEATIDGVDVSKSVVVKSTLNANKPGQYTITYIISNEEGYKAELSRNVYVYDTTPNIMPSKIYQVQAGTNRNGTVAYSGYSVAVYQSSPGVFAISDFLGGYYDVRAAYGPAYAAVGTFEINNNNTLSLVESYVAGWKDSLSALNNGKFDPATNTITFTSAYAGFNFNVILK